MGNYRKGNCDIRMAPVFNFQIVLALRASEWLISHSATNLNQQLLSSFLMQISFHPLSKSIIAYKVNGHLSSNGTGQYITTHLSGGGNTGLECKILVKLPWVKAFL